MRKNIIPCHEGSPNGPSPRSLRYLGISRILQRSIVQLSFSIGSYGMGGPGFWGFKFRQTDKYPEEWLILTLWGAGLWLVFDGDTAEVATTEETMTISADTGQSNHKRSPWT